MLKKEDFTFGKNQAEKWLAALKNASEVILYPAGVAGMEAYRNLSAYDININYFGDNDPSKIGTNIYDTPILSLREIVENHSRALVVISTRRHYREVFQQFLKAGFDSDHLIMVDYSAFYPDFDQEAYLMEHFDQYRLVYDGLEDRESRRIFLGLVNYRLTFDFDFLKGLASSSPQYFEKGLVQFGDEEVFVDGGGFTGDTFCVFEQLCPKYKKYYLCEPDPINFQKAQENLPHDSRLQLVNKGLYNKQATLFFQAFASGVSSVSANGTSSIEVTTIDQLVKGEKPTFIKMDIEGSEYQAMLGARASIQAYKPKLAISIYHKPEDILLLPSLIKSFDPSYRLYLRHYSNSYTETICYAF